MMPFHKSCTAFIDILKGTHMQGATNRDNHDNIWWSL